MLNWKSIPGMVIVNLTLSCLAQSISHQQTTVIRKYPFSPNCSQEDRDEIVKCEDDARKVWRVDDVTYYTSSRSFCCFVWDTLSCALETAEQCDPNYAAELSIVTEQTLESLCDYSQGSSSCAFPAWSWWPLVPIIIGCLTICSVVLFLAYPKKRQRSNTLGDYEMAECK